MPTKTQRPTTDAAADERRTRMQFFNTLQRLSREEVSRLLCIEQDEELTALFDLAREERIFSVATWIKCEMIRRGNERPTRNP